MFAERRLRDGLQRAAINRHRAGLRFVKPLEQCEDGALAAAALTDERASAARRDFQGHAFHCGLVFSCVGESDVFKADAAAHRDERLCVGCVLNGWRAVEQFKDLRRRGETLLHHQLHAAERLKRRVNEHQRADEREHGAVGKFRRPRIEERAADAQRCDGFHRRPRHFHGLPPFHHEAQHRLICLVKATRFVVLACVSFYHADAAKCLVHEHHHPAGFLFFTRRAPADFLAHDEHRQQTQREEQQRDDGEFPIVIQHHADCADDGDRLLHDVARDARERLLGHARLIENRLHKVARFLSVKKLQRLPERVPIDLLADIIEHALTHPQHTVGIQVGKKPAQRHCHRNREAHQHHDLHRRATVQSRHGPFAQEVLQRGHWPARARHHQVARVLHHPNQ